ncbi:MAG: hypothetical protein JWM43_1013 [Acidobacteriaceae bacterium]|nr:hypothetical protein [Acidobacteriaceae bacterium]
MLSIMSQSGEVPSKPRKNSKWWLLPLLLPYVALLFPRVYASSSPALMGFPFFYWYQFLWVILTSAILAGVYFKLKSE